MPTNSHVSTNVRIQLSSKFKQKKPKKSS